MQVRLGQDLRVSNEDLPTVQHVGERDAAVAPPLLQDFDVIDEDDKVIRLALVENLGCKIVGARHFEYVKK